MSSTPFVLNNDPYHQISSSSSCSSLDISHEEEEYYFLNEKFSQIEQNLLLDQKQDCLYWSQRTRNNLSAKRSRVKRRMNDLVLETKLTQLTNENEILRAKIDMLTKKFGENTELFQSIEQPTVLNILNQSTKEINSIDQNSSLIPNESLSSIPVKLRFKLLNITSDS